MAIVGEVRDVGIDVEGPLRRCQAIEAGRRIADDEVDAGADLLIVGDMGIGNTTAATALIAALIGTEPVAAVGRGTGIDDAAWSRKTAAVRDALYRSRDRRDEPVALLAACGAAPTAAPSGTVAVPPLPSKTI